MKIRVTKREMNKALLWYTNELTKKYQNKLLTAATIETIKQELNSLQNKMKLIETNPVWEVPVKLYVEPQHGFMEVVVEDENNILFVDQKY